MRMTSACAVAAVAILLALPEGRAQTGEVIRPPVSQARAKYFKEHPDEWKALLERIQQQRAQPSQAAPQPVSRPAGGGTWTAVPAAPIGLSNPLLLTDGTVIAHQQFSETWYKLTPDAFGSYSSGTWTKIASLPAGYGPTYFASAVLPDGRVIIEGGEYNETCTTNGDGIWTSLGAIYNPLNDLWTAVAHPTGSAWPSNGSGWVNTDACGTEMASGGIGDASSIVLPDGTFLLGAGPANPPIDALLNATDLTWSAAGAPPNYQDEMGYTLLRDGTVLTIDIGVSSTATYIYHPALFSWTPGASTSESLTDPCGYGEIGPALTRNNGTVVAFGGNTGCNAPHTDPTSIYNPSNNTWSTGPTIPSVCGNKDATACTLADAPAALLPSGNILFAASTGGGWTGNGYPHMTHFFEFTTANTIIQITTDPPNSSNNASYVYNLLVLPTGQIMMTDFGKIAQLYNPLGSPDPAWAPVITSVPLCLVIGSTYSIAGTQLNGLSQGAAYGDDVQAATNFPLIQIKNSNGGQITYARTTGFSTMSIAPNQASSASFTVPFSTFTGASTLYAIANGIPSAGIPVTVGASCGLDLAHTHDFNADGKSDLAFRDTSGNTAVWLMNGSQILQSAGLGLVPTTWQMAGQRDFNGDGRPDLLWRDGSGDVAIWFMNGAAVASTAGVAQVPTTWTIAGTGDFNADGKADILWHDTSGNVAIWFMNGSQVASSAGIGQVPTAWSIVGTGDFNGDDRTDILWRDSSGNVTIWFMNGSQVVSSAGFGQVPTVWSIAGTGDFNGDAKSDILWHDTSGDVAIWFMNGSQVASSAGIGQVNTIWSISQTGDYNEDAKSDILWRDTSGNLAIWFMNGATVTSTAGLGNVGTTWSVQAQNAE